MPSTSSTTSLGVIGLGTMGANLARNAARNGAKAVVFNRTTEKTDAFMKEFGKEGDIIATNSLKDFVESLTPPRPILLMVKAGDAVDEVIEELRPLLSDGDILIDGGNSHYRDTERRVRDASGYQFLGMGVSGGEEGALNGPSMMPGGSKEAFEILKPLLTKMAAADGIGGKCVAYIGEGGTGNFVKTVHNGIEYGLMQLMAESYHLLKQLGQLSNGEIADVFTTWSTSDDLRGFLMEITAQIFRTKDDAGKNDLIDIIKDAAGQKGTGKWTTDAALSYGVAVPTITAAVDARIVSSAKDFRINQSKLTPLETDDVPVEKEELIVQVREALELSMLNVYAQGLQLLTVASKEEGWNLNLPEIMRIWRGGCIIRSLINEQYQQAFAGDKKMIEEIRARFRGERQQHWRHIVALGALRGIPLPAMSASLSYYDAYRSSWLPQNLIQAQRDFFGNHGFERLDKEGAFHGTWR